MYWEEKKAMQVKRPGPFLVNQGQAWKGGNSLGENTPCTATVGVGL